MVRRWFRTHCQWSLDSLPLPSPSAPPFGTSAPRVRVVVPLTKGPFPLTVLVEDDHGCQVPVELRYINLPPLCPSCLMYGHWIHRCPQCSSPSSPLHPVPDSAPVIAPSSSNIVPPPGDTNPLVNAPPVTAVVAPPSVSPSVTMSVHRASSKHSPDPPLGHTSIGPAIGPHQCDSSPTDTFKTTKKKSKSRSSNSSPSTEPTKLLQHNSLQSLVMGHKAHIDLPSGPSSPEPTLLVHPQPLAVPLALRPLSLRRQTPTKTSPPPTSDASFPTVSAASSTTPATTTQPPPTPTSLPTMEPASPPFSSSPIRQSIRPLPLTVGIIVLFVPLNFSRLHTDLAHQKVSILHLTILLALPSSLLLTSSTVLHIFTRPNSNCPTHHRTLPALILPPLFLRDQASSPLLSTPSPLWTLISILLFPMLMITC